jgi:hypothetical protein
MLGQVLGSTAFAKRLGQRELRFNKRCFFWRQLEEISSRTDSPAPCLQSRAFCPVHDLCPLAIVVLLRVSSVANAAAERLLQRALPSKTAASLLRPEAKQAACRLRFLFGRANP